MREKLHDIIHFVTGEVLHEEMFPVDVAIYLKRNAQLEFLYVEENFPRKGFDRCDTVWVDGKLTRACFQRS
ncbi:MAG TPA: hypothetical protein EYO84_06895 [Planctomycetes bacterium]|nr:hypothetical protein [Planctomycetota bacterium]